MKQDVLSSKTKFRCPEVLSMILRKDHPTTGILKQCALQCGIGPLLITYIKQYMYVEAIICWCLHCCFHLKSPTARLQWIESGFFELLYALWKQYYPLTCHDKAVARTGVIQRIALLIPSCIDSKDRAIRLRASMSNMIPLLLHCWKQSNNAQTFVELPSVLFYYCVYEDDLIIQKRRMIEIYESGFLDTLIPLIQLKPNDSFLAMGGCGIIAAIWKYFWDDTVLRKEIDSKYGSAALKALQGMGDTQKKAKMWQRAEMRLRGIDPDDPTANGGKPTEEKEDEKDEKEDEQTAEGDAEPEGEAGETGAASNEGGAEADGTDSAVAVTATEEGAPGEAVEPGAEGVQSDEKQ